MTHYEFEQMLRYEREAEVIAMVRAIRARIASYGDEAWAIARQIANEIDAAATEFEARSAA